MKKQPSHFDSRLAFTLIELLVVIAIIAILVGMTAPTLGTMTSSLRVSQATDGIAGQLNLARQRAMTRNKTIEARFYQLPASGNDLKSYRAVWLVEAGENATNTPVQRPFRLPDGVVIGENTTVTSLMELAAATDTTLPFPGFGNSLPYRTIRFYPNGETDLNATDNWFLSCYQARTSSDLTLGSLSNNFATIQVLPKTGAVRIYRP